MLLTYRRKRTFAMCCDPYLHVNPPQFCTLSRHKIRPFRNTKPTKHKFNLNPKCDYIGNPKPCKRRRISLDVTLSQCNAKPKITPKARILHQCAITPRYKQCKQTESKPNYPILAVFNVLQTPKSETTNKIMGNSYDYSHCPSDTDTDSVSTGNSADTVSSYQSAYTHFDDDSIPNMSINDPLPMNDNYNQQRWSHNSSAVPVMSEKRVNSQSNEREFKWNMDHRIDYSPMTKRIETKAMNVSQSQSKDIKYGINDFCMVLLRYLCYICIVLFIGYGWGIVKVDKSYLVSVFGWPLRKDRNVSNALSEEMSQITVKNSNTFIIVKWLMLISGFCAVLYTIYKAMLIGKLNNDTNTNNRFKFKSAKNIHCFKPFNTKQSVIAHNYYNFQ